MMQHDRIHAIETDRNAHDYSSESAESFYTKKLTSCEVQVALLSRRCRRLVNVESALTILLALLFYVLHTHGFIDTSFAGTAVFVAEGLLILTVPAEWLRRTASKLGVQRRIGAYYESRLSRLRGTWAGTGDEGSELSPIDDPLCRDFDLFGTGSLFEYLCSAKTGAGRRWLAASLLNACPLSDLPARHQAIVELREKHGMRESFASIGSPGITSFDGKALSEWLEQPCAALPFWIELTAWLVALVNLTVIFLALGGRLSPEVPPATLACVAATTIFLHKRLGRLMKSTDPELAYELALLRRYRQMLGSEAFQTPLLSSIRKPSSPYVTVTSEGCL